MTKSNGEKRVQVHFNMPLKMAERLQNQAKKDNRSVANWIKDMVIKILNPKTV